MEEFTPTGVKADRNNRTLTISWNDGHVSSFSFDGLRLACPCVTCKGGHVNMGTPTSPAAVKAAKPTDLALEQLAAVGSYALQPLWSDGHSTGIYSWKLLRALDPPA